MVEQNNDSNDTPSTISDPIQGKKFRVNPVEILILLTMTVVVGNSAYNLLYGTDSFRPSEFKSMVAQSTLSLADGRAPASTPTSAFASLEVKCQKSGAGTRSPEESNAESHADTHAASSGDEEQSGKSSGQSAASSEMKTSASKVRLNGVLCGDEGVTGGQLVKATVLNNNNRFNATVFTDSNSPQFTTDYIPLADGKNTLKIEFAYRDGKTSTQEINISKTQ
jgi:hypothetical protein